jgi:hypothetical protein
VKLPNAENVIISEEKITRYLLVLEHPEGGPKARFFRKHGFTEEEGGILAAALREHARAHQVARVIDTPLGLRYAVEGPLNTPLGQGQWVRSVCFLERGESVPRLVSAYPCKRGREP